MAGKKSKKSKKPKSREGYSASQILACAGTEARRSGDSILDSKEDADRRLVADVRACIRNAKPKKR